MRRTTVWTLGLGLAIIVCVNSVTWTQPTPLPISIPQRYDPLLNGLSIPADAHQKGMWSAWHQWPLNPIHAALTPDGKVVTFGSPLDDQGIGALVFDVWNPRRGFVNQAHRQIDNVPNINSFCAASTLLRTGELLTSGGTVASLPPQGSSRLNGARYAIAATEDSLDLARYYATQTVLADGRVLITGGAANANSTWSYDVSPPNNDSMSMTPEVYTPGVGWDSLSGIAADADRLVAFGAWQNRWWYPRQWVAPDGRVFGYSTSQMWYLDPNGVGSLSLGETLTLDPVGELKPNIGATSTAVMYDVGKILQVGGNGRANANEDLNLEMTPSSQKATIIDINSGTAVVSQTTDMNHPRQWATATVLPNGHVLVTGGTTFANSELPAHAVLAPEIWDPENPGTWTDGNLASRPRTYHSTALLLPNGTVLTGGGGGVNNHLGRLDTEVYYPPYLFKAEGGGSVLAPRPQILRMKALQFDHEAEIQADVNTGHAISKVRLIGLGAVTHSFDMGQRLIPVESSVSGTRLTFTAPNANHAPPGYYLLFVINADGVPSEGVIIAIGAGVKPPPRRQQEFDVDGDGITDLGIWRPRPYPQNPASSWQILKSTGSTMIEPHGGILNGVPDIPVPADYDGDGKTDLAIYRPQEYIENLQTSVWQIIPSIPGPYINVNHGAIIAGKMDFPVRGDYDGDGRADLAIWRPSEYPARWIILKSSGGITNVQHGGIINNGIQDVYDIPVPGDYDGDGKSDLAIYRTSENPARWLILKSSGGLINEQFGEVIAGKMDVPVPGDYDGDGINDLAIWRPSEYPARWIIRKSSGGTNPVINVQHGGIINDGTKDVWDIPVPGDYDGDGITDLAIYRPRVYDETIASQWLIWMSATGTLSITQHGGIVGGITDIPVNCEVRDPDTNNPRAPCHEDR